VPKVRFEALARIACQRDVPSMLADIAADLIVAAALTMFVAQTAKYLRGRVALLGRRVLIVGKDRIDDAVKGAQRRCWLRPRVRTRFSLGQNLPNLLSRVMKSASDSHECSCRWARRISPY
jgi:hypothetical protein